MKKVDVETSINKYLNTYPITMTDLLGRSYQFNSLEKYLFSLKTSKSIFVDSIDEFSNCINNYIDKVNLFIKDCLEEQNEENIDDYVSRNTKEKLGLNSYGANNVNFIFSESFTPNLEQSEKAIKQIYSEMGFEALKQYLELVRMPSHLSSFISSGEKTKQTLAAKYMLYITDHHSSATCKRDTSAKTLYKEMESNISEALNTITNEKEDYVNYMSNKKTEIDEWFDKSQDTYNEFMNAFEKEKDNLIATYEAQLKVSEPAEYMLKKAKLYKWQSIGWSAMIIVMIVILICLFGFILSPKISVAGKAIEITIFSNNIPIPTSIIIIVIISIILYALKIFVKMAISSKHLYEEYHQKHILTYFYLSLINDGKINDSIKDSIILSLFSKSDTGLIKGETNSDLMELMKTIAMKK